jgi:FkbM family methyltransferase
MLLKTVKKKFRRNVRFNGLVERGQQKLRMSSRLSLRPIGLEIDTSPTDILIDCGANIGDVTSTFARTGATVYAFEPNSLCFSILNKRFAFTPNVKCFNQGVMDRECTLPFSSPKAHFEWDDIDVTVAGSFKGSDVDHINSEVRCISLSNFIFSLNKNVRLLKMDIEGSEIEVINNLLDTNAIQRVDLTIVETHEKQRPSLLSLTNAMRNRITDLGLVSKIRLDWI